MTVQQFSDQDIYEMRVRLHECGLMADDYTDDDITDVIRADKMLREFHASLNKTGV